MKRHRILSQFPRILIATVMLLASSINLVLADVEPEGNTFRLAGSSFFESLDPAFVTDMASTVLMRQVWRGLTVLDAELEPAPGLAESWEISGDGLEYKFTLRADAVFHDGRPVEAEDVAASLARALDPETAGGEIALLSGPTFLADIEGAEDVKLDNSNTLSGIRVIDDDELTIRLSEPQPTFLIKLASPSALILDRFEFDEEDWWLTPNGSGPFMVDSFDPDSHLYLERFQDFSPKAAEVERIEFRLGADALQPLNLYEGGELDITGISGTSLESVAAEGSGLADELVETPLLAVGYIAFRRDVEPLNDPKIRQALWLGFPRAKVAEISADGYSPAANGFLPAGLLGVDDWPVEMPDYDLEAARQAIAESSYGSAENVPPIRIYVGGSSSASALRDVVFEDLGLRVEVIHVEWSDFTESLARQELPAYEMFWYADYPDPEALLELLFGEGRPDNYVGYEDSEFNALLEQARAETEPEARIAAYNAAQQVLLEDFVVIPVYYGMAYTLVRPWVEGLTITPMGLLYLDTVSIDS